MEPSSTPRRSCCRGAISAAWGSQAFEQAVARINAQPAKAAITLSIERLRDHALQVEAAAQVLDPGRRGAAALYLAVYQNKLVSRVDAGENQGRTLAHDFVVRDWVGPIEFASDGRVQDRRSLSLPPETAASNAGSCRFRPGPRHRGGPAGANTARLPGLAGPPAPPSLGYISP